MDCPPPVLNVTKCHNSVVLNLLENRDQFRGKNVSMDRSYASSNPVGKLPPAWVDVRNLLPAWRSLETPIGDPQWGSLSSQSVVALQLEKLGPHLPGGSRTGGSLWSQCGLAANVLQTGTGLRTER